LRPQLSSPELGAALFPEIPPPAAALYSETPPLAASALRSVLAEHYDKRDSDISDHEKAKKKLCCQTFKLIEKSVFCELPTKVAFWRSSGSEKAKGLFV
jgi:hypothetical protein